MSNDEQRIAIAEACGYKRVEVPSGAYGDNGPCKPEPMTYWFEEGWNPGEEIGLHDYLNDLNAMHEAEATLGEHDQARYQDVLAFVFVGPEPTYPLFQVIHATAAQRAEAFLRTIGRWKDK